MENFINKVMRKLGIPSCDFVENTIQVFTRMESLHQIAVSDANAVKLETSQSNDDVIVSLTTYGKRIDDVYLVIESIFQQTYKPNKIILWLDEQEFNDDNIPMLLKKQQTRGLIIGYYKNIRSYKKLIPTLKLYSDSIIITIDDDKIYPHDLVERLMYRYKKDPNYIYFTRGRIIGKDAKGYILPYNKWELLGEIMPPQNSSTYKLLEKDSALTMPTGTGGVLYPPHSLHPDVLKEDIFMQICPFADDIWFKAMSFRQGVYSKYVYMNKPLAGKFLTIPYSQTESLSITNVHDSKNDIQLKQVMDYYSITF